MVKTFSAKPSDIKREWFVVDAEDRVLGRLATEVALRLRGKHKPIFTPHMDTGDFIVIINADKIRLTANKLDDKLYYRHSRFPGGLKSKTARQELEGSHPERVVENAIRGMLPKTKLGRDMYRKLKVYKGAEHPHAGQNPVALTLD
ncbi:MAG: 50S ribosomal protein L13 [Magnetococcales bacterium]|nr:50S ribosomal protein L13 [Magnetococcales bacterium]